MGGVMVFDFQEQRITLLHNRDNWDESSIEAAAGWNERGILGGWCKSNHNYGIWMGVSKQGRFACLVDSSLRDDDDYTLSCAYGENSVGPSRLPVAYLMSQDTPEEFAARLRKGKSFGSTVDPYSLDFDPRELTYQYELIVGDVSTSKMFHISKPVKVDRGLLTRRVPYGVHTVSLSGLDNPIPLKDTRLRNLFEEYIGLYENGQISLKKFTEKVMGDRTETEPGNKLSCIFVEKIDSQRRYGTTSSTAFIVQRVQEISEETSKPILQATFYEQYVPGSKFTFDINVSH